MGRMRKPSPIRRRTVAPAPRENLAAMRAGPPDEQAQALGGFLPSIQELLDAPDFQEVMHKAEAPRAGVAMAQIDIGGTGHEKVPLYRPVGLGFDEARQFVDQFLPAGLIVNRRIRQVQRFLDRPKYDYQPGFQLRWVDESRSVQEADTALFSWTRRFLMNGGAEFDTRVRRAMQRDRLMEFTAKHLRDSLTADHAPIELIPTPTKRVHGFQSVDMARVYLTDPNSGMDGEYSGPAEYNQLVRRDLADGDPRNIVAVYEEDGAIKAHYSYEDMLLPIRNATSDGRHYGYGMAEPDRILRIGSYFLDALTVNGRAISDNSVPRAVLNLIGDYDQKQISELRQTLNGQGRGAANRFRIMTIASPSGDGAGAQLMPVGGQVDEALYSRWITLLVAITCGVYLIDPTEIGFESFSAGNTSSLSGSDTEAKLTSSADAGLHSLLRWYQTTLSDIVQTVQPDVEVYFTGLDENKEDAAQRESSLMSLRQALKVHGMSDEGVSDLVLDAPLNPSLMQPYMAAKQQEQQAAAPDQGPPGAPQPGTGQPAPDGAAPDAQDPPAGAQQPAGAPDAPGFQTTPTDPEHPAGPNGEPRYQDGDGGVWQRGP